MKGLKPERKPKMKQFSKKIIIAFVIVALLSGTFSVFAQNSTSPWISEEGEQIKSQLLTEFKNVLENEINHGQT
jgi:hypothetical protein